MAQPASARTLAALVASAAAIRRGLGSCARIAGIGNLYALEVDRELSASLGKANVPAFRPLRKTTRTLRPGLASDRLTAAPCSRATAATSANPRPLPAVERLRSSR